MASRPQWDKLKLVVDPEDRDIFGQHEPVPDGRFDIDRSRRRDGNGLGSESFDERLDDRLDDDRGTAAPRSRAKPLILALILLMGVAGTAWYAYNPGVDPIDAARLPLVLADSDPIKSKPENPGGLEVRHQDKLVLNQETPDPNKPQVERLLPPPEVPKPPEPAKLADTAQSEPARPETAQSEPVPALDVAAGRSGTKSTAAPGPVAETAPSATDTGAAPSSPSRAQVPAPAAPVAAEPKTPPAPAQTKVQTKAQTTTQTAARTPAARSPAGGAYVVQLAALKTPDGTKEAWARLRKAHPNLLGDKELTVQTVELGSRGTFYRVQAGFFPDRAAANALCLALKARNQDCLVVKR